ncbi:MAG: hypothetical protein ACI9XO_002706 [Paraglaciecola sp.]|jgi:hypothetical protein
MISWHLLSRIAASLVTTDCIGVVAMPLCKYNFPFSTNGVGAMRLENV